MKTKKIRTMASGATRNDDTHKLDFEGFLHPKVLKEFGKYMHKHRHQADGSIRNSDNWQKGMSKSVYMKSMLRHVFDAWEITRQGGGTVENSDGEEVEMLDVLMAVMFNVQGMAFEIIKNKK